MEQPEAIARPAWVFDCPKCGSQQYVEAIQRCADPNEPDDVDRVLRIMGMQPAEDEVEVEFEEGFFDDEEDDEEEQIEENKEDESEPEQAFAVGFISSPPSAQCKECGLEVLLSIEM
jgi:hypothetical protein